MNETISESSHDYSGLFGLVFHLTWISFLSPSVLIFWMYYSALVLTLQKFIRSVLGLPPATEQQELRITVKPFLKYGKIFYGHEVCGMENVPTEGPALIVYYHGATPLDAMLLIGSVYEAQQRLMYTVADNFLFKVPGFSPTLKKSRTISGSFDSCVSLLKKGNILTISPGGLYEAQFGDHNYELLWRNRLGFAKVALEAKVPIIPMFTENCREAYRVFSGFKAFFEKLYFKTKFIVYPVYGGLPVKLRTHLGTPIYPESHWTPEELREKVQSAIKELIMKNQRLPGSMTKALMDRFQSGGGK